MIQIPAVNERCAGIDIGKRELAVSVIVGPADQEGEVHRRLVGTTVPALEELKQWLLSLGCTSVAMESTGSYWIPVKNVLEGSFRLVLVCPRKHHPKRGDKTDFRDADMLAHHQRHGLLRGSFLPSRAVVELRDLTRRRKKLLGNLAAEKNRIQKVLETANVKLGNIISDMFGVSGQAMIQALLSNPDLTPEQVAELAKRRLRQRLPELVEAVQRHQLNDHHRWLIGQSIEHAVLLDRQLEELETCIQQRVQAWPEAYRLLQTIPGIQKMSAATILAEIGPDMSFFPSAGCISKWAGVCPGNNRSAGKNKSSRIDKANKFLLAALVESAWAAARTRNSVFRRRFHHWVHKMGKPQATVAIAHNLLRVIYAVVRQQQPFREPDPVELQQKERAKLLHHTSKRLRQLGADPALLQQVEQSLATAPLVPADDEHTPPTKFRKACPAKICRGALGFRARQTRKQEYSVVRDPAGDHPPRGTRKKNNSTPPTSSAYLR
jgi:transposase